MFNVVVMPACSSEPDCSGEGSTQDPSASQVTFFILRQKKYFYFTKAKIKKILLFILARLNKILKKAYASIKKKLL